MREHPDAYKRRVNGVLGPATKNRIAENLGAQYARGAQQWEALLDLAQRLRDVAGGSVADGMLASELASIEAYIETGEFPLMGE